MENSVEHDEQKSSRSTKNSTSCKFCDENHADKSKSLPCSKIQSAKKNKVLSRQTTLSDYFSKQEVENPTRDEEPKSADVIVDFRRLVRQLLNAKVVVEKLPPAAIKAKTCPTLRINIERMQLDPHQQQKIDEPLKVDNYTLRYCHKCKTSNVDYKATIVRRKCHNCGTVLLFVCNKCNSNLYPRHGHMVRHRKICDGRKESNGQGFMSIKFYYCADCEFFTAYEGPMTLHVSRTQHKILKHA